MRKSDLQEIIRELIQQELDETSFTGNVAGYDTPFAFSGGKKKDKKKKKKNSTNSTGYEVVNEEITDKDLRKISDIVRMEVALIFFDLFKKKALWT